MSAKKTQDESAVRREKADVSIPLVLVALGIISLFVVVGIVVASGVYVQLRPSPLEGEEDRPLRRPPEHGGVPLLFLEQDRRRLEEEWRRLLTTVEWVDREAGHIRIPIERAMQRVLAEGLPHAKEDRR